MNVFVLFCKNLFIGDGEEWEYVENLFDVFCVVLIVMVNKKVFYEVEGIELMCLIMKLLKGFMRLCCVKVINYVILGLKGIKNCIRFVDC